MTESSNSPSRLKIWLKPMFGKVPYARWEWVIMRTLFAIFCIFPASPIAFWLDSGYALSLKTQIAPNGIAQFVDLTFLTMPAVNATLSYLFPILIGLYIIGLVPFAVTTALFAIHVGFCTLINSQGAIHHTGQVVGYALLGQILYHAYRWIRHFTGRESIKESAAHHHRDLIYGTLQAVTAAYVIAGLSKIINSGWNWIATLPNMVLQIEKNYGMKFHDSLVEPAGKGTEFGALFIINYPTLAKIALTFGLLLELFCFLALWNRAAMAIFGAALISMHMVISSAMHLGFLYNKATLAIFFINIPFWIFFLGSRFTKPKHPTL